MTGLKTRIRSGNAFSIGFLTPSMSDEQLAETSAGQNWDLAFVDLQHSPYSEPGLVRLCRCCNELGVPVMFRIQHPDTPWHVSRCLDFGALGTVVPMVEEPASVHAAVANFYYPPLGRRSCGLATVCARKPNQTPSEYAAWWNANGILAIQIETVQGVLNARQLALPGLDLILFGGSDLALSLEATPDVPFDSVAACQDYVVAQTADLPVRVAVSDLPFGQFGQVAATVATTPME